MKRGTAQIWALLAVVLGSVGMLAAASDLSHVAAVAGFFLGTGVVVLLAALVMRGDS